ncbi:MAG: PQQ-dependent sugar dehydrogenase [Brevinematales bacterium]|nr:PQQ-dependent sugar dehydrogenase [Brevinematales bacterium]
MLLIWTLIFLVSHVSVEGDEILQKVKLQKNFSIDYYYKNLPKVRAMKYLENGILIAGSRTDKVYMIIDTNMDYKGDIHRVVAENLDWPVGVDVYKNDLYISSVDKIVKIENILKYTNFNLTPPIKIVYDKYPKDRAHGWKYIRFGPDGKLYVPVGAPCNVCLKENPIYSTITRINPDGTGFEIYANGVRNTVGFDWDPQTGYMWFSENGRDWMGDDLPPDEINVITKPEQHYGFPFIHGKSIKDPEFSEKTNLNIFKFVKPVWELPAHVAPLGIKFYKGTNLPQSYREGIFIAEHGSWNRSKKIGYRLSFLKLNQERLPTEYIIIADFLENEKFYGRPVDIEFLENGSILLSDDHYGNIFRITYKQ